MDQLIDEREDEHCKCINGLVRGSKMPTKLTQLLS